MAMDKRSIFFFRACKKKLATKHNSIYFHKSCKSFCGELMDSEYEQNNILRNDLVRNSFPCFYHLTRKKKFFYSNLRYFFETREWIE